MSTIRKFLKNPRQSRKASPSPSRPTPSHAATGPVHATGAQSVNVQSSTLPAPVKKSEALQTAIQEFINTLSDEDKAAFQTAPDIIEHLQKLESNRKHLISSSLSARVGKVLDCVKHFMGSIGIFIQHSPEISALVVGGVNCILTVRTYYLVVLAIHPSSG